MRSGTSRMFLSIDKKPQASLHRPQKAARMPPPHSPPKAILFDLDGTLIDSIADLANSANAMLGRLGHPAHPEASYLSFVGDGARALVERCLPAAAANRPEAVDQALDVFRTIYRDHWHDQTTPYPGIPTVLASCASAGIPLAVLSNKPHEFTTRCVRHFFPQRAFSAVIGQRAGIPVKPDPASALAIAADLGLAPSDCALVGDTRVDILTAVQAGMRPVGVLWGFRKREELTAAGATTLVTTVQDLTRALGL